MCMLQALVLRAAVVKSQIQVKSVSTAVFTHNML